MADGIAFATTEPDIARTRWRASGLVPGTRHGHHQRPPGAEVSRSRRAVTPHSAAFRHYRYGRPLRCRRPLQRRRHVGQAELSATASRRPCWKSTRPAPSPAPHGPAHPRPPRQRAQEVRAQARPARFPVQQAVVFQQPSLSNRAMHPFAGCIAFLLRGQSVCSG